MGTTRGARRAQFADTLRVQLGTLWIRGDRPLGSVATGHYDSFTLGTAAFAIGGALLGALLAALGTAANPGLLVLACASSAGLANVAVRRRLQPASLRAADEKIVQYLVLCSLVLLSWSLLGRLAGLAAAGSVALVVGLSLAIDGFRKSRRRP